MLNLLRSDFYRLLKDEIIYITMAAFWSLSILFVIMDHMTGKQGFTFVMEMIQFFLLFTLPLIYATGAVDFSSGAVKNTLSFGTSRTKFYISKLIVSIFFCTVMYIGAVLIPMSFGILINGMGEGMTPAFLLSTFKAMCLQLLLLAGAASLGIFLIFVFKKIAVLCTVYTAYFLGTQMALYVLSGYFKNPDLMKIDFSTNIDIGNFNLFTAGDIIQRLCVAAFYIIVLSFIGIILFKKSDIK